jgi:hypothetical protein
VTSPPSRCLVELVLSASEFGPHAEPALRRLQAALEIPHQPGPVLRTGMAVTQEFGKLDITVRAVVAADDLMEAANLAAEHLRHAIDAVECGGGGVGHSAFREQSVRASWT